MKVVPYDPSWQGQFELEAKLIQRALGSNCLGVHHIGSTSVPGLAAKPVIDIMPVVKDIAAVDTAAMQQIGYVARGENGMPFRRFFQKDSRHVHVFEEGSSEISRHLKFRDWLRTHQKDAAAYASLKFELAKTHDQGSYCLAKEPFITAIDAKDGYTGTRMVVPLSDRERAAALALRQDYFQKPTPQNWSWEEPNHTHLVLYHNTDIAGYAHLQFLQKTALLHVLIIDESFRYLGLGRTFLHLCERWLAQQGITYLYLHATKEAAKFYAKGGYKEMSFEDPTGDQKDCISLGKRLK